MQRIFHSTTWKKISANEEMFREVGISVAINPERKVVSTVRVKNLPELMIIAN